MSAPRSMAALAYTPLGRQCIPLPLPIAVRAAALDTAFTHPEAVSFSPRTLVLMVYESNNYY